MESIKNLNWKKHKKNLPNNSFNFADYTIIFAPSRHFFSISIELNWNWLRSLIIEAQQSNSLVDEKRAFFVLKINAEILSALRTSWEAFMLIERLQIYK